MINNKKQTRFLFFFCIFLILSTKTILVNKKIALFDFLYCSRNFAYLFFSSLLFCIDSLLSLFITLSNVHYCDNERKLKIKTIASKSKKIKNWYVGRAITRKGETKKKSKELIKNQLLYREQ